MLFSKHPRTAYANAPAHEVICQLRFPAILTINDNAPTYNLAGQRVGRAYRGIVVKNGKKRIIR